jgi:WD repeat-containing protein 22
MASGGDDRRILVWNVEKSIDAKAYDPGVMQGEHDSNIFCVDFDVDSKNVFSGGNDERVLIHDIATSKFVNQYLQEEPVFGISCHPGETFFTKRLVTDNIFG